MRRNSNNLRSLKGEELSAFQKEDFAIAQQELCVQQNSSTVIPTHATSSLACLFTGYVTYWHVWDLVDQCFALDSHPAALKDELLLCIQARWNSLPQADIQNLFDSMPRHITALIASCLRQFPSEFDFPVEEPTSPNFSTTRGPQLLSAEPTSPVPLATRGTKRPAVLQPVGASPKRAKGCQPCSAEPTLPVPLAPRGNVAKSPGVAEQCNVNIKINQPRDNDGSISSKEDSLVADFKYNLRPRKRIINYSDVKNSKVGPSSRTAKTAAHLFSMDTMSKGVASPEWATYQNSLETLFCWAHILGPRIIDTTVATPPAMMLLLRLRGILFDSSRSKIFMFRTVSEGSNLTECVVRMNPKHAA
ncbi:hypothetical protein TNCV_4358711 [Trichonephila clavipes]|nr:hypothetical protein TNCV_4358711 [Trichonephila clavipes]